MARVPLAIFNDVQPQKCSQPEGLSRKTAIHCVMLLDNNQLLPSSHALCLAVFRLSAIVNETSTDPKQFDFALVNNKTMTSLASIGLKSPLKHAERGMISSGFR
ncbi:hypothetical protein CSQ88_05595 [Iodobacter sp. BJB302]|nr:hypothetical protein CSQ88_05595 [Iodobacter sp. BJB302]